MTVKGTWKAVERRIASMFFTKRTPLSGGNSGHTRSDTLHKHLFIEIKHRKGGFAATNLLDSCATLAKKENKTPIVALHPKGSSKVYFVVRAEDIDELAKYYQKKPRRKAVKR